MTWDFDVDLIPKGGMQERTRTVKGEKQTFSIYAPESVIVATKCGKVIKSQWLPADKYRKVGRWAMLAEGEEPVAWMPWPDYPEVI